MGNETSMMFFCALMSAVEGLSSVLILGERFAFPVRHCLMLAWLAVLALVLGVFAIAMSLGHPELLLSLIAHRSSTFFPVALTAGITLLALLGYLWAHYQWSETRVTLLWASFAGVASLALVITTANLLRLPWNLAWQSPWIVITLVAWSLVGVAELGLAYVRSYRALKLADRQVQAGRLVIGAFPVIASLFYLGSVPHFSWLTLWSENPWPILVDQGGWLWFMMFGFGVVGPWLLRKVSQIGRAQAFAQLILILVAVMSFHSLVHRMGEF